MKRLISQFSLVRGAWALGVSLTFCHLSAQELRSAEPLRIQSANSPSVDVTERRIRANAHYAAGIGHHAKGEVEQAAKELLLAVEIDPNNSALILRVAEKLLEWRLLDQALEVLETASQQANPSVDVFTRKGITLKALGKEKESLVAFKEALAISPGNAQARRELVTARLIEKDVEGALNIIREGVALPSLSGEQLVGLVELYIQTIASSPNLLAELKGELLALLERTQKFKLEKPEHRVVLADGFTFTGEIVAAQEILEAVVQSAPDTALAREKLVDLYLREGMAAEAVEQLNTLIALNPRNPSAHYLLGSIAADNEEFEKAVLHYEKAIEIRPEFEPPYYEMVGIHLNTRQPRKALDVLTQARIRFPKRFLGEFYTGIALASLRRTKEALTHLSEAELIATKQAPQRLTPFFYFQLGSMFERNGNLNKAEEKFLKSLAVNPDDAETLNYLGYMWAEKGKKLRQASEWISKAMKLEPDSAAIQDSMGWVLFQLGEYKKALPHLLNAEAGLEQPDPVILEHLGDTYHALGQKEKASKAWESSLELEFNERIFQKIHSKNTAETSSP
ncbi:tetratricopeptide repeat protein [bacterium]|jgi:tetratricopeptide (TPR) repeat protein|nr:tetratricopeptide repeat protein [bacterium]